MAHLEDLNAAGMRLERLHTDGHYTAILQVLDRLASARVCLGDLRQTAIARCVSGLERGCADASVRAKARSLLRSWNRVCALACDPEAEASGSCKPFCSSANNIAECPELSQESTATLDSQSLSGDVKSCVVHGSASERRTGPHSPDSSVLETEPSEEESKGDKTHLIELAKEIERAIFGLHPSVDKKYRACLRSKIANLRHPQNGELAGRVRAGAVSPARFAAMTPEEMACSELRHLRNSYQQAALREHQLPHRPGGTPTDRVRCRRCGKFNCSVSVVCRGTLFIPGWVRGDSPDEQLMTFLTCEECGEKWYNA
uniref:TFIIS central domain-containing protein n=1 Tax=Petromyzon marinus TaxID=7757 RepID=S4RWG0_PETMA